MKLVIRRRSGKKPIKFHKSFTHFIHSDSKQITFSFLQHYAHKISFLTNINKKKVHEMFIHKKAYMNLWSHKNSLKEKKTYSVKEKHEKPFNSKYI